MSTNFATPCANFPKFVPLRRSIQQWTKREPRRLNRPSLPLQSNLPDAPPSGATPFRPVMRPPMALLYILDDGSADDGEIVRLRKDRTTVGRREGDVVINHDTGMSGRHIEISRKQMDDRYRWFLKDLGSTNGTFVRCDRAKLKNKFEILIGSRRFRFEDGSSTPGAAPETMVPDNHTRPWNVNIASPSTRNAPVLVEMTPTGDGRRYPLNRLPCYIGTEPTACDVLIDNDPLVCPVHVKLEHDDQGNLFIEDAKSFNGTWLRIKELPLDCNCSFQCGEQRFLLRFP